MGGPGGEGTARAGAAIAYVALWSSQILAAKAFASQPHGLQAVTAACLAAELLKLLACAAALRAGPLALLSRAASDVRASGPNGAEGRTLLFVAGCYIVYNVLSYVNLAIVPASVYKALLSARLAFAVGLDTARTGRCPAHRAAGAAAAAAASLVVSPFHAEGSAAFVAVCAQAFLSALAGALTQRVLQAKPAPGSTPAHKRAPAGAHAPDAPPPGAPPGGDSPLRLYLVDLAERNASLYTVTSTALAACLALLAAGAAVWRFAVPDAGADYDALNGGPGAGGSALSAKATFALALSVALSAAAGLSTSHLLTVAGNVAKAMLAGAEVCAVTMASAVLFGEKITWRIFAGALLTLLGFALHERVLPLPPALLARLPPRMQPVEDGKGAHANANGSAGQGGKTEERERDSAACGRQAAGTAIGLFAIMCALIALAYHNMWYVPGDARLSHYVEARDAPLATCADVPVLWAPGHKGQQPARYALRRPHDCPAGAPFYSIGVAPHGGTLLSMNCSGGVAHYSVNFLDDDVRGVGVAGLTRGVQFAGGADGSGGPITLSHKVTHLELACTRTPPGRRASHTRREVAWLPGPMVRRLEMAGDSEKCRARYSGAGSTARPPHVVVLLMDALSRATAESVLPELLALLRQPGAFGDQLAAALEFRHFNVVGMSSDINWQAMFCGGNCSGPGSIGAALPLLDAAKAQGFATLHMNNFCPPYPSPWLPNTPGPEVRVLQGFTCLHPGDRVDCRLRDSVSRSWLAAGAAALSAPRPSPAPPVFALIAPHEAHSKRAKMYDRLRRMEPELIGTLRQLNSSGTLADSLLLLVADHGLHYGLRKELYAPAAEAHRGPILWALVGSRAAGALLGGADPLGEGVRRAKRNAAERLVTMHDLYRLMADAMSVRGAGAAPGAPAGNLKVTPRPDSINPLQQEVPADRTCAQAGVPPGYCGCLHRKTGLLG